jgi:uncharacterized protein YaiE (UPF0345 family)
MEQYFLEPIEAKRWSSRRVYVTSVFQFVMDKDVDMLSVNEYFGGQVKSIGFLNGLEKATVGVMAPGEYIFTTGVPELMVVIRGALTVLLPGQDEWKIFEAGDQFEVPANSEFQLQVNQDTAYLCEFKS